MLIVLSLVAALILGVFVGITYAASQWRPQYHDPQLHNGQWELTGVVNGNVTWRRMNPVFLFPVGPEDPHTHYAHECNIMSGLAHVDTCACGKKRYGVFGSWS